ncbi:MAG: hypothetical protein L0154_29435 [Chloroflexi bacterium]|nr:hypothetical protein [Chloroflexota bacterium]
MAVIVTNTASFDHELSDVQIDNFSMVNSLQPHYNPHYLPHEEGQHEQKST